jgi:hypothetical protein
MWINIKCALFRATHTVVLVCTTALSTHGEYQKSTPSITKSVHTHILSYGNQTWYKIHVCKDTYMQFGDNQNDGIHSAGVYIKLDFGRFKGFPNPHFDPCILHVTPDRFNVCRHGNDRLNRRQLPGRHCWLGSGEHLIKTANDIQNAHTQVIHLPEEVTERTQTGTRTQHIRVAQPVAVLRGAIRAPR